MLKKEASSMAKRVVLGEEERKISGEMWRRVAIALKLDWRRVFEAFNEREDEEKEEAMGTVVSESGGERRVVETAMKAKATERMK